MNKHIDIANRLRFARERKGLQQKFVASKLGIHNSTLSKMEKGIHEPDAEKLKIFSDLYDVSPEWILYGELVSSDRKTLTEQEMKILALFNGLSDEGKDWLVNTITLMRK